MSIQKTITDLIDLRVNKKLTSRRRIREKNIHIPTHNQEFELVIGGGEADVSNTLTSTSMNFTMPQQQTS